MRIETHCVGQFTKDGRRVATISGLGPDKSRSNYSKRTAQRHAAALRKSDTTHDYRVEDAWLTPAK